MSAFVLDESGLADWGRALGAAAARHRAFVALQGPLGAGKTTLVKAACAGAGVGEPVTSPTFTLVHCYAGEAGPVFHVDLYRIADAAELLELGWDDLVSGQAPVFVEWADRAGDALPPDRWDIRLSIPAGGAVRAVEWAVRGDAPPPPAPSARQVAGAAPGERGAC